VIVCLVTDRHRRSLEEQTREAVRAGVDLIHVRERDLEAGELSALVDRLMRLTRGTRTRVVVNDRLDVALACGADGVHLRADSISARDARSIAPAGFIIGRSIHRVDEVERETRDADYAIAGTVFPTPSKPARQELLGLHGLAAVAAAAPVPVLAIGGISMDRIEDVASAGAGGIAAIGLFADARTSLVELVAAVRRRFDSVKTAS
jgi:thiamine-phosphate pyrophosphorylase